MSGPKIIEQVSQIAEHAVTEASYSLSEVIRNWLVLMLAGLGVTMAVNQFIGGLLLAVAMAAVARRRDRRRGRGLALYSALTACVLAIATAELIEYFEVTFPAPLAMGLVGFFSRNIVNILSGLGDQAEKRTEDIADKVIDKVLPGDEK